MMRSFIVFGLVLVSVAQAQFGPDVRVSDTTGGFFGCVSPWIAYHQGILYSVWASDYTGSFDCHIYFSKSTDMGKTWAPGKRVDDATPPDACLYPCLAVDPSGNLYCVWWEMLITNENEILFSRSTDGGATWAPSVRLDSSSYCTPPHITTRGGEIFVVWTTNTLPGCAFTKSTDGGTTWMPLIKVGGSSFFHAIAVFGDTIFVTHEKGDVYLSRSTDDGATWQNMGRINDITTGKQDYPDLALTPNGDICCAWYDWSYGMCKIRFSKSTDGGVSWLPSVRASDTIWSQSSTIGDLRMNLECVDENRIYCLWHDFRTGSWDIFFTKSEDGGVNWSEDIMVNDTAYVDSPQMMPCLCLEENGNPCVVWDDAREGLGKVHIYFDKGEFPGIKEMASDYPLGNSLLLEVYPNPFGERVNIRWKIGDGRWKPEDISLKIYDATGRLVKEFIPPTASTVISWDGRDESGRKVRSGVYFLKFEAGDHRTTEKLLLVK